MIEGIKITTEEQWDAVPVGSRCRHSDRVMGRWYKGAGDSWPGAKTIITHIAIPVDEAIEARRVLLTEADVCRAVSLVTDHQVDLRANANRLDRIADLIMPPPLADAAEAQATPPPTCAEVLAEALACGALSTTKSGLVDRARAALPAEGEKR